jgi:glycosyltransferase involved in cell wall biosynthesis
LREEKFSRRDMVESKQVMLRNLIPRAKASLVYRLLVGRWVNQGYLKDPARVVNSLYQTAFGRRADPQGLANRIHQLQSGVPLEILAQELVGSPEFQARHGSNQKVDIEYITALYLDGLGRKPDPEGFASWLAMGAKGGTRAKVLAAFAASEEALEKALTVVPALLTRETRKEMSSTPAALRDAGEIGAATILASHFDPASKAANYFLPFLPINILPYGSHTRGPTLQILLPSLQKKHASGGPNTAYILGCLLAAKGIPVNFVSTDVAPDPDPAPILNHLQALTGMDPRNLPIRLLDASNRIVPLEVDPHDIFFATAWWTAQMAKSAAALTSGRRIYYLIQDFEPVFYGASESWSLAMETYSFDHVPVINTSLLRDFLREKRIGRFADPAFADNALVFEPAVDAALFYPNPSKESPRRRLLFYARPTFAVRNLFGLGLGALRTAVQAGLFGNQGWEFIGMGEEFEAVPLGRGYMLKPAPWLDMKAYAEQMRGADLLLSLMQSPHPSYPPLEMAACGRPVVTTEYETKTAQRLAQLSPDIIGVAPNIEDLVWGLQRAIRRSDDRGLPDVASGIRLPSGWEESFASIMNRLLTELRQDGIRPSEPLTDLPPATSSTALALRQGDATPFYQRRMAESRRLYRPASTPGLISIVSTVYDTDPTQLCDLAQSLLFSQDTQCDFEWVILDNGSALYPTRDMLARISHDPRVRMGRVEKNLGIIRGMRWCLEHALGRYIVPVDSDDLLFPHCLRTLGAFIEQTGFPPLIYTDEDMTDGNEHKNAYVKPEWDPVLFAHSCYIAHLTAIDRLLAKTVGCYSDSIADGSHDWNTFTLFLNAGYEPAHLPEILYTWRMHSGSTSSNYKSKPYIYESQKSVLELFLLGRGKETAYEIELSPIFNGTPDWRFRPVSAPDRANLCTIIITTDETGGPQLAAAPGVVHTARERLAEALRELPSQARFVHLLDARCEVVGEIWYEEAVTMMDLFPDTVAVGGRIHDAATIIEAGLVFGFGSLIGNPDAERPLWDPGYFAQMWKPHTVGAVSACHCVVRREFLQTALMEIPPEVEVGDLGPWLGAIAISQSLRSVYSPFLEARMTSASDVGSRDFNDAALISRFGHLIRNSAGYAIHLDRGGSRPYAMGEVDATIRRPSYQRYLALQGPPRLGTGITPIALLTPVYERTNVELFRETAVAVAAQTSQPAEWIVVAQGPISPKLDLVLRDLAAQNALRLLRRDINLGIAGGLRLCLEQASSEFVLSLDADDLLIPDALLILADEIAAHPEGHIFYTDEDLLIDGEMRHPYYRPDFDPALIRSHSYVWHAIAVRRETSLRLGAYTDGDAEFATDWDIMLRFAQAGHKPIHVPKAVYHWRQHAQSVSNSGRTFKGTLDSVRHILTKVAAGAPHPEHYEVLPYPYRIGEMDYYLRRKPQDAPSTLLLHLGDGRDAPVFRDACAAFPFAGEAGISAKRGTETLYELTEALASSPHDLVFLLGQGVSLMDAQGLWQAVQQLELIAEAMAVGGPLVDVGGIVLFGSPVELPDGSLADTTLGKPLRDPGPFSIALKPHCPSALTPDMLLARREHLLEALRVRPEPATLRGLGAWLGHYARRHNLYLVYEPVLCGTVRDQSALLGDPIEGLERQWHWISRQGGVRAPRPIKGLAGFAWHARHHD